MTIGRRQPHVARSDGCGLCRIRTGARTPSAVHSSSHRARHGPVSTVAAPAARTRSRTSARSSRPSATTTPATQIHTARAAQWPARRRRRWSGRDRQVGREDRGRRRRGRRRVDSRLLRIASQAGQRSEFDAASEPGGRDEPQRRHRQRGGDRHRQQPMAFSGRASPEASGSGQHAAEQDRHDDAVSEEPCDHRRPSRLALATSAAIRSSSSSESAAPSPPSRAPTTLSTEPS